MAKRKTALDHLNSGREPHIVHLIPPGAPGYREADGGAMVVSSPAEVNAIVRTLKPGEVITLDDLRAAIARRHAVAVACPVSTAIFLRVVAEAAWDERQAGARAAEVAPFRRVIAPDAPLAKKLRRGLQWIAQQRAADRTRPCGRVRRIQVMAARVDQQEWRRKVRRHARGSRAWPSPACRC